MIEPRWRKVLADLGGNKTRTLLTVLTIAVGIFAVGFVSSITSVMLPDMNADYHAVNPHSAILYSDYFDDELLPSLRQVPGVGEVEGRSTVDGQIQRQDSDKETTVSLIAIPPAGEMKIDRLRTVNEGDSLQVGKREVLIESSALNTIPSLKVGDLLRVELSNGSIRELRIAGFARDVTTIPAHLGWNAITAYISPDTLPYLGAPREYNQLYLSVAENKGDEAHIKAVADAVQKKIEASGRTVYFTFIYNPGQHFAAQITQGVAAILGVLGGLSVFLSIFLIVNTLNALLAQHTRQIGVMKAIGGRTPQIVGMYLTLVMGYGLLALLPMVPLSAWISYQVAQGMSSYLNFRLAGFRIPAETLVLQTAIALGVPLLAALVPVWTGTRLTIREALSNYGLGSGRFGRSWLDRLVEKIRFLSRPLLISLRNTIRRKTRLVLTLFTLMLGGAIFVAVVNLYAGVRQTLAEVQGYFLADINVNFGRAYRFEEIAAIASTVPGVESLEGWGYSSGQILSPDKATATQLNFVAPPSNSKLLDPILTAGRWVQPGDENAIVIGNHLLKVRPDLRVGDEVVIKINERETTWKIVGFYRMAGNTNPPLVYTNYEYLSRLTNIPGLIGDLRIITTQHDATFQYQVMKTVQATLEQAGIKVTSSSTSYEWQQQQASSMDMLIYFMMVMALLIAVVGGLGLMGTMSMNVLERTREIGVMRAIGASNGAIFQLILVEGLLIGIMSWVLSVGLSLPITAALNAGVGVAILSAPMALTFGWNGILGWLALVILISVLASLLPAWNAVRLTVRDVLAYE